MSPTKMVLAGALLLELLTVLFMARGAAGPVKTSPPVRVLFIGNSFVYSNNLPKLVEALAAADAGAPPIETQQIAPSGWTLRDHVDGGEAVKAIASGRWDFVVLQEQSTTPITNPAGMIAAGQTLARAIDRSGARTVLMLTWSRRGYPDQQVPITRAYMRLASQTGARVAPIGEAWWTLAGRPGLELHARDGSHPSAAGSYLAACVLYHVLTGRSPLGLPGGPGVAAEHVEALQAAAVAATLPAKLPESPWEQAWSGANMAGTRSAGGRWDGAGAVLGTK